MSTSATATPSARTPHTALLRFGCALLGVAAMEWLALGFAGWTWRAIPALGAAKAGGTMFYAPFLALLVAGLAFLPAHAAPELARPTVRGTATIVLGAAAVLVTGWLYRQGLLALVSGRAALPAPTPALISATVLAPLVEEWLFRGVLWRQLAPAGAPPAASLAALVLTSIAFGWWHLPFDGHSPIHVHALFGVAMGVLRWRTGSIVPGVVLHGLGNGLSWLR